MKMAGNFMVLYRHGMRCYTKLDITIVLPAGNGVGSVIDARQYA